MRDTLRAKFFDQFVETAQARSRASSAAVREDSAEAACSELHSLAGECSMLGFDEIATFARDAESEAKLWAAGDASKRVRCGRVLRLLQRALDELVAGQAESTTPRATPSEAVGASGREFRVLIVDDSEIVADQIQDLLQERDVACRIVSTMEQTMGSATEFEPEIALVDLNMPGLDTAMLVACLQQRCPDTKILLISGLSDEELERRSRELKTDGFISKQRGIAAVIETVAAHLPGLEI